MGIRQILVIYILSLSLICQAKTPPPEDQTKQQVRERYDLPYFATIDSIRSRMVFMDTAHKRKLIGLDSIEDETYEIADLSLLNYDFSGTIEYVRVLPDSNYLIYEDKEKECDCIWKFWPEEMKLYKVFTFRNEYQSLKFNWGIEYNPDKGIMYLSEYGNSAENPINKEVPQGSENLGYKAGASKIWMSDDNCETWNEMYDFKSRNDIQYDRFHIHALHYDTNDKVLYVTTGDGWKEKNKSNKRLWWTSDGKEWNYRDWSYYWGKSNDAFSHGQLVSMYADTDFILAAGDDYNNCIYLINKATKPKDMQLKKVYFYDTNVSGKITQYGARFKKLGNGMIAVMLINGDSNGFPRRTRLVATFDGYYWYELFTGPVENEDSNIFQYGIMEEWQGKLYFCIQYNEDGLHKSKFIEYAINDSIYNKSIAKHVLPTPPEWYDLNGRRLASPAHGVNIYKKRSTVKKIVIQ